MARFPGAPLTRLGSSPGQNGDRNQERDADGVVWHPGSRCGMTAIVVIPVADIGFGGRYGFGNEKVVLSVNELFLFLG